MNRKHEERRGYSLASAVFGFAGSDFPEGVVLVAWLVGRLPLDRYFRNFASLDILHDNHGEVSHRYRCWDRTAEEIEEAPSRKLRLKLKLKTRQCEAQLRLIMAENDEYCIGSLNTGRLSAVALSRQKRMHPFNQINQLKYFDSKQFPLNS